VYVRMPEYARVYVCMCVCLNMRACMYVHKNVYNYASTRV